MTREEKNKMIESLAQDLKNNSTIYLADVSGLTAEQSSRLRRSCFNKNVGLKVVKNTLLKKAMEKVDVDFEPFHEILVGNTSIMFSEIGNDPARLIRDFRKKSDKPILKGAYVEESFYIGDGQLNILADLKSKNELIADIVALLQSPAKNVISSLQSGGNILSGIVKTLAEREN